MILGGAAGRRGGRGGRRQGSGLGEGHSKAGEVKGSGARGLSSPGTSVGLRALWGLLEKEGRSLAKRLVWSCPAPSGPQILAAMLRPAAVTTVSWLLPLPSALSPPHHHAFPFRKRESFIQSHQPMALIRPLEGCLLWPWGPSSQGEAQGVGTPGEPAPLQPCPGAGSRGCGLSVCLPAFLGCRRRA